MPDLQATDEIDALLDAADSKQPVGKPVGVGHSAKAGADEIDALLDAADAKVGVGRAAEESGSVPVPKDENSAQRVAREHGQILDTLANKIEQYGSFGGIPKAERAELLAKYKAVEPAGVGAQLLEGGKAVKDFGAGVLASPGSYAAAVVNKFEHSEEAGKALGSASGLTNAVATDNGSSLTKYLRGDDFVRMKKAQEAAGTYHRGIAHAVLEGNPWFLPDRFDKNDPKAVAEWAKKNVGEKFETMNDLDKLRSDADFSKEIARAVIEKGLTEGEKSLSANEAALFKKLSPHIAALQNSQAADDIAGGAKEGLVGGVELAKRAALRTGEALTNGTTDITEDTLERLADDHRKTRMAERGMDATTKEARSNIAHLTSLADPINLAGGELLSVGGKALLKGAVGKLATSNIARRGVRMVEEGATAAAEEAVKKGGLGASMSGGSVLDAGKNAVQASTTHGGKFSTLKFLGNAAKNLGGLLVEESPQAAERLMSRFGPEVAGLTAEALGFSAASEIAGDDNPLSQAGGAVSGHYGLKYLGGIAKAKTLGEGVRGLIAPAETAADAAGTLVRKTERDRAERGLEAIGDKTIDTLRTEAYDAASPKQRALMQAAEAAGRKLSAATGVETRMVPVKDAVAAKAFISRLSEKTDTPLAVEPMKGGGFFVEAGGVSYQVSRLDSPLFERTLAHEHAHAAWKALPDKVKEAVLSRLSDSERAKLEKQGITDRGMQDLEYGVEQLGDIFHRYEFNTAGHRAALANALSNFLGLGGKSSEKIGTYDLVRDMKAQDALFAATRDKASLASSSVADPLHLEDNLAKRGPVFEEAPLVATPQEIAKFASQFDRHAPQKAIAAKAIAAKAFDPKADATTQTAQMSAFLESSGFGKLLGGKSGVLDAAVDEARRLSGLSSVAESERIRAGEKAHAEAEQKARDISEANAKVQDAEQQKLDEARVQAELATKARRAEEEAQIAKEQEQFREEARKQQESRAKAEDKVKAKQEAVAAIEAAKTPELKELEATKKTLAALGVNASKLKQVSDHLSGLFTLLGKTEPEVLSSMAKDALAEWSPGMDEAASRAAKIEAVNVVRRRLMDEHGMEVLTSPEAQMHPEGTTKAQWEAAVKARGMSVLRSEANRAATAAVQAEILKRLTSEPVESAAPAKAGKAIPEYTEPSADEVRSDKKDSAGAADFEPQKEETKEVVSFKYKDSADPKGPLKERTAILYGPDQKNPNLLVAQDLGEFRDNILRARDRSKREFRYGVETADAKETQKFVRQMDRALVKAGIDPAAPSTEAIVEAVKAIQQQFKEGFTPSGYELSTGKVDTSKALFGLDPWESEALMTLFGENYERRTDNQGTVSSTEAVYSERYADVLKAHGMEEPLLFGNLQKNAEKLGLKNTLKRFSASGMVEPKKIGETQNINRIQNSEGHTLGLFAGNIAPRSSNYKFGEGASASIGAIAARQESEKRKSLPADNIAPKK